MRLSRKGERIGAAILEVVDNQLRDNQPPETRLTFERLCKVGRSEVEAKRLIGAALSVEIYEVLKNREAFNHDRFVRNPSRLPRMPWEK